MFGFPSVEKSKGFQYKKNFLKTVIFQIKYQPINTISKNKSFLDNLLKKEFPKVSDILQGNAFLKIDKTPVLISQECNTNGIEYRSETGNRVFSITSDTINYTIFGNEYQNFTKEFEMFNNFVQQIVTTLAILNFTRIAIRKVNVYEFSIPTNIENNPIDFLHILFKNHYVENILNFEGKANIVLGLFHLVFEEKPYRMKLSYGLVDNQLENPNNNLATLDIDIFNNQTKTSIDMFYSEMEKLNFEIFKAFNDMITTQVKEIMNAEQE